MATVWTKCNQIVKREKEEKKRKSKRKRRQVIYILRKKSETHQRQKNLHLKTEIRKPRFGWWQTNKCTQNSGEGNTNNSNKLCYNFNDTLNVKTEWVGVAIAAVVVIWRVGQKAKTLFCLLFVFACSQLWPTKGLNYRLETIINLWTASIRQHTHTSAKEWREGKINFGTSANQIYIFHFPSFSLSPFIGQSISYDIESGPFIGPRCSSLQCSIIKRQMIINWNFRLRWVCLSREQAREKQ